MELRVVSLPPTINKPNRADELAGLQVACRIGVREHRDQVEGRRGIGARVPQFAEILAHLQHLFVTLVLRMHDRIGRIDIGDRHIGPPAQLHPVFPGEVEQRRQHHVGEIGRDALGPVEGLVARQGVQHIRGPLADQRLEIGEVGRRDDRCDGASLGGMAGRVHADEAGALLALRLVGHLNTAEFRTRRIVLVIELDRKNVVVARHRPIRPERRGLAIMHGIVAAQLFEQRPPGVVLIKVGIADVDRRQLALQRLGHRLPPLLPSPLDGRS